MSFANDLNVLLARKNMTQAELADALGVSRQAVQVWASGRSQPRGYNLVKLREALGLSPDGEGLQEGGNSTEALGPAVIEEQKDQFQTVKKYRSADTEEPAEDWTRVPVLDVYGSCGGGSEPSDELIVGAIDFYTPFLRTLPGVLATADNLEIIHSTGDSMSPTIERHALCLVDRRQSRISDDAIYVIQAENQIFIKRVLRNFDGSITLISDNPSYPPQKVPKELAQSACVIGRIVYVFNGKYI